MGGGELYTWADCKVFFRMVDWVGGKPALSLLVCTQWKKTPLREKCLVYAYYCIILLQYREGHWEEREKNNSLQEVSSYCISTKHCSPESILPPCCYSSSTKSSDEGCRSLHSWLLPAPVATIWLHYYCQFLWQKYGYIIIASSCGKNMVALLLPAPVATIWLHYHCQFLWQ